MDANSWAGKSPSIPLRLRWYDTSMEHAGAANTARSSAALIYSDKAEPVRTFSGVPDLPWIQQADFVNGPLG